MDLGLPLTGEIGAVNFNLEMLKPNNSMQRTALRAAADAER